MKERFVHLSPRLAAARKMLEGYETVADIGCDHGRLTASMLQTGACKRVVASDVSEPSLDKAKHLIEKTGLRDRVSFRVGNGCSVLKPYECDAIALLGMGGTLMCRILGACEPVLMGAKAVVLQPMRAQDDIREYLHKNGFHITEDWIVPDHGRYYQIFKAVPGIAFEPLPEGFPSGFYDVGYKSFQDREEHLPELCRQQLHFHESMLKTAIGTEGETRLREKADALQQILKNLDQENAHEHF